MKAPVEFWFHMRKFCIAIGRDSYKCETTPSGTFWPLHEKFYIAIAGGFSLKKYICTTIGGHSSWQVCSKGSQYMPRTWWGLENRKSPWVGVYSSWCKGNSSQRNSKHTRGSWGWEMVLHWQNQFLVARQEQGCASTRDFRSCHGGHQNARKLHNSWRFWELVGLQGESSAPKTRATRVKFFILCNFLVKMPHRISFI